jgi:hypothetical protein
MRAGRSTVIDPPRAESPKRGDVRRAYARRKRRVKAAGIRTMRPAHALSLRGGLMSAARPVQHCRYGPAVLPRLALWTPGRSSLVLRETTDSTSRDSARAAAGSRRDASPFARVHDHSRTSERVAPSGARAEATLPSGTGKVALVARSDGAAREPTHPNERIVRYGARRAKTSPS